MRKSIIFFIVAIATLQFSVLNAYARDAVFIKKESFPTDIRFKNVEEKFVDLSHYTGKPIVLAFWATWCVPCVAEMSSLDVLKNNHPDINVIALSIDRKGISKVKKFYKKHKIQHLDIYTDKKSTVYEKFGIKSLPFTVLYDAQGKSVGYWNRAVNFTDKKVIDLIKKYK